jgi:DNA-binding MurR/RpiR family transcriptional regulator
MRGQGDVHRLDETPKGRNLTIDMSDVIPGLGKTYEDLTLAQKRIAEVIVEDPEFVAFATVDKLAIRLKVSPSTIVRFAYRMGLEGYPDLQRRVRDLVRGQLARGVGTGDGASATAHLGADGLLVKSLAHDIDNLYRTVARLDVHDLEKAVGLLVSAREIYVAGSFGSESLAQYTVLTLGRIRGGAVALTGDSQTAVRLLDVSSKDAVLAFSFPPYSSVTLDVVRAARRQGASVVTITDTPLAPIAQSSDVTLSTSVSGVGPQNSLIAPMAVANALLNAITVNTAASRERYARVFAMMNEWDTFLLRGDDD